MESELESCQRTSAGASPLRVLLAVQPSEGINNPYGELLARSLSAQSCSVRSWSWRFALIGAYDVIHLHWPEGLLRGNSLPKRLAKWAGFLVLLLRWSVGRVAVVETIHNETPHEPGNWVEGVLLAWKNRLVRHWIAINPVTTPRAPITTVILHGHYRDVYSRPAAIDGIPGKLLFFGMIRPYKGVPDLIRRFCESDAAEQGWQLRIIGDPSSVDLEHEIKVLSDRVPSHVSGILDSIPDSQLVAEIASAEAVILPYRRLFNSGVALTALSLGVPVIMPRVAASIALQQEVRQEWVVLYDEPLTGGRLLDALHQVRLLGGERDAYPDLAQRDWDVSGRLHLDVYEQSVQAGRAPHLLW